MKKTLKFAIDVIVYIFMIINVKYLTSKYLMYECDNNCAPNFPVILQTPMLSVCFDWLEVARLADSNINWTNLNLSTTLDEWLTLMPDPSQLIDSCAYRNSTLDVMMDINSGLRCAQFLAVTRYRMQGYLCYKFQLLEPEKYSYHTIVNSLYDPRQLFAVTLQGAITKLNTFYPIIHVSSYPDFERIFERPRFKKENAVYHLSYGIYESLSMPAPYETRCVEWTQSNCFQQCMDIFLEPHDLVSDASLVVEYSMDSYRQLMPRGSPLTKEVENMRTTCYKKCKFDSCSQEIVATSVSPPVSFSNRLTLVVESLARPVAKIQQIPKYLFYDYATQVCSWISIWVGINFTSILVIFRRKRNEMLLMNIRVNLLLQSVNRILGVSSLTKLTQLSKKQGTKKERNPKKRKSKIRLLVLDLIISILVFCLFGLQLINVLKNYFEYSTTIRFSWNTNVRVQIPAVSLCLGYSDAFNFSLPSQVTEVNYREYFTLIDSKINKTLETLFSDLHSDDVIAGCHLRNWTDRMKYFIDYDKDQCLQLFKVSQFFMSQKFCYQVEPRKPLLDVYQADVSSLFIKPSVFLTLDLDEKFSFDVAQVYLGLGGRLPDWDNEPATITSSENKREITISTRLFINYLLKPPYDTQCSSMPRAKCHSQCLDQSMDDNVLPYLATVRENSTVQPTFIMEYANLIDENFYATWRRVEKMCEARCNREMCQYNFTTAVSSGEWPVNDNKFKLSIESPSSATSIMETNPVMVIFDLTYQVMCCLSFWLGFSIVAINPLSRMLSSRMNTMETFMNKRFIMLRRMIKTLIPASFAKKCQNAKRSRKTFTEPSLEQFVSFLIHLIACICCLAHLIYQMEIYLQHATYIDVSQDMEWFTDHSLHLCLDRAELAAKDEGLDMFNLTVEERTSLLNRPVGEIFSTSPPADSIIKGCSHRGISSRRGKLKDMQEPTDKILFHTSNISECYEHYSVWKMIAGSLLCYSFCPKNFTGWSRIGLRGLLNEETTLFTITINSSLLTTRFSFQVVINDWLPVTSSEFAPNLYHDSRYNYYIVSYLKYISSYLPTQYPNQDFNPFMFDRCLSSCITKAFKSVNRTFSTRFFESTEEPHVKYLSLTDRKMYGTSEKLESVTARCEKSCLYYNEFTVIDGSPTFTITIPLVGTSSIKQLMDRGLTLFNFKISSILVFTITYNVRISLFEQIINLGSIISIWFGFSAISLARLRKLKQRKITNQDLTELENQLVLIRKICKKSPRETWL